MRTRALVTAVAALALLLTFGAGWIAGRLGLGSAIEPEALSPLERAFATRMRGASLVGYFTVTGRGGPARPDTYHIASVEKVGEDRWRWNARIGSGTVHLPLVLPMRWVGDTPMILMTDVSIPAMGTFTARVFFHEDRYAGTWQHGDAGGHLYGTIEQAAEAEGAGAAGGDEVR